MNVSEALVPLTDREEEVVALIAEGKSRKKIARELDMSEHTVNSHCDAIATKLHGPGRFAVRATVFWIAGSEEDISG